jgi:hypothetical protein
MESEKCYSFDFTHKNLESLTLNSSNIIEEFTRDIHCCLFAKLSKTPKFQFEIMKIDFVFNQDMLKKHRDLFYDYAKKLNGNDEDCTSNIIPKNLLVFHGCKPENIQNIFDKGLNKKGELDGGFYGSGFYVTTYPQYALHYVNFNGCDKNDGFKIEKDEEIDLIGGFALPGKKFKVTDLGYFSKPVEDGIIYKLP